MTSSFSPVFLGITSFPYYSLVALAVELVNNQDAINLTINNLKAVHREPMDLIKHYYRSCVYASRTTIDSLIEIPVR